MDVEMSSRQRKTVEKIERLRAYFKSDRPEIYEWSVEDEAIDFVGMSDQGVTDYLAKNGNS
jgi:hypothetical protein